MFCCNNGGFRWTEPGDPSGYRPIGQAEDYSGGRIERDAQGNPTGLLRETAVARHGLPRMVADYVALYRRMVVESAYRAAA